MIELESNIQRVNVHKSDGTLGKLGIILPTLMPDELLLGYFGRFGLKNGFPDYTCAKSQVKNIFINNFNKDYQYPLIYQMSDLLSSPPTQIVRDHTLVPLLRSVHWNGLDNHHINLAKSVGYKLAKNNVVFCRECVKEDIDYLGVSYWRRGHQIHGVDTCTKHQTYLHMAQDNNAFYMMPSDILKKAKISCPNYKDNTLDHPVIKKYTELIEDYVLIQNCINIHAVLHLLVSATKNLNIRRFKEGRRPLLSDFIKENVPHEWLNSHFPDFNKKVKNVYLQSIDGIFLSHNSTSLFSLILAISVLLPHADSSIFNLDNEVVKVCPTNAKSKIDTDALIDSYYRNRSEYSNIADEFNISIKAVRFKLAKSNLPALGGLNRETSKALSDFMGGAKLEEVILRKNVNIKKLSSILRVGANFKKAI